MNKETGVCILLLMFGVMFGNATAQTTPSESSTLRKRLLTTFLAYGITSYYGPINNIAEKQFVSGISDIGQMSSAEFDEFIYRLVNFKSKQYDSSVGACDSALVQLIHSSAFLFTDRNREKLGGQIRIGMNKQFKRDRIWRREVDSEEFERLSRSEYLFGICKLWNLVHLLYPYKDLLQLNYRDDFDIVMEFYHPNDSSQLAEQYYITLKKIANLTKDCHTGLENKELKELALGNFFPPLGAAYDSGIFTICNFHQTVYDTFKLDLGDTITHIDGIPVAKLCDSLSFMSICQSPDIITRYYLLSGKEGTRVELQILGRPEPIQLYRTEDYGYSIDYSRPYSSAYPGFLRLNDSTVYIKGKLTRSEFKAFRETEYSYLIYDMTYYPTLYTNRILGSLLGKKPAYLIGDQVGYECFDLQSVRFDDIPFYPKVHSDSLKKIFVLQNKGTASWGESIILGLHEVEAVEVEFWGQNTSGTMGSALYYRLPGNVFYRTSSDRETSMSGKIYQFEGIPPEHYLNNEEMNIGLLNLFYLMNVEH